jgi:hypothetical protein
MVMNSQTIEIDVLINLQDYLKANYWYVFKKMRLMVFILLFLPPIYLAYMVANGAYNERDNYWGLLIPWGLLLMILVGTYFSARWQLANNRALNENHHYIFSADGVISTSASTSGHVGWDNFREAFETTKSNYLKQC